MSLIRLDIPRDPSLVGLAEQTPMSNAPSSYGELATSPASRIALHNIDAEMAVLGTLILNNKQFDKVSEILKADHFASGANGRIFSAITSIITRGHIADVVTLQSLLESEGIFDDLGGKRYLGELVAAAEPVLQIRDYASLIFDFYLRRELIEMSEDVVHNAYHFDPEITAVDQIESAESTLFNLSEIGQNEGGFQPFKQALAVSLDMADKARKRDGMVSGVPTGFNNMDSRLGGLHPSDLLILAGRPGMGKTALATNMAFNAAIHAKTPGQPQTHKVAFFSLEMSAEQLATRILAERSGVGSDRIRRGAFDHNEFQKIYNEAQFLENLSLFIDDTPGLTVSALRSRARRLKRQHGLDLIMIDYLQLMQGDKQSRAENRVQEISQITRGLKGIAKELDVPVLALSQLSRAVEAREDKRPQLADLRESGSIEQDADVVMFIYREEYYLRHDPKPNPNETASKFQERYNEWQLRFDKVKNKADVIIAKQRHGPTGTIELKFNGETTKFEDFVENEYLPEQR